MSHEREKNITRFLLGVGSITLLKLCIDTLGAKALGGVIPTDREYFVISGSDGWNSLHTVYLDPSNGRSATVRENSPWWYKDTSDKNSEISATQQNDIIRVESVSDLSRFVEIPVDPDSYFLSSSMSQDASHVAIVSQKNTTDEYFNDESYSVMLYIVDTATWSYTTTALPAAPRIGTFQWDEKNERVIFVAEEDSGVTFYSCNSTDCLATPLSPEAFVCTKIRKWEDRVFVLCGSNMPQSSTTIYEKIDNTWKEIVSDQRGITDFTLSPDGKLIGYDVLWTNDRSIAVILNLETGEKREAKIPLFLPPNLSWENTVPVRQ